MTREPLSLSPYHPTTLYPYIPSRTVPYPTLPEPYAQHTQHVLSHAGRVLAGAQVDGSHEALDGVDSQRHEDLRGYLGDGDNGGRGEVRGGEVGEIWG